MLSQNLQQTLPILSILKTSSPNIMKIGLSPLFGSQSGYTFLSFLPLGLSSSFDLKPSKTPHTPPSGNASIITSPNCILAYFSGLSTWF